MSQQSPNVKSARRIEKENSSSVEGFIHTYLHDLKELKHKKARKQEKREEKKALGAIDEHGAKKIKVGNIDSQSSGDSKPKKKKKAPVSARSASASARSKQSSSVALSESERSRQEKRQTQLTNQKLKKAKSLKPVKKEESSSSGSSGSSSSSSSEDVAAQIDDLRKEFKKKHKELKLKLIKRIEAAEEVSDQIIPSFGEGLQLLADEVTDECRKIRLFTNERFNAKSESYEQSLREVVNKAKFEMKNIQKVQAAFEEVVNIRLDDFKTQLETRVTQDYVEIMGKQIRETMIESFERKNEDTIEALHA